MRVLGVIAALISFMILIMSHEFGHFSVAKYLGIKVNEFSIGMGPHIFQKQSKETLYSIRAIPIGGYCMLEGEESDSDDPRSFSNQPWWSKILVLMAGSLTNIVLGILMFTLIFCYIGAPSTTLGSVDENTPAYEAGLLEGDKIIEINGSKIKSFAQVQSIISTSKDEKLEIVVLRNGQKTTYPLTTITNEAGTKLIGIRAKTVYDLPSCFKQGVQETSRVAVDILSFFRSLLNGSGSVKDVSGVVGVVAIASKSIEYGFINFIYLMAMITANLGYMNLLPIPALDGGRILMVIIRTLSKGKITDKAEQIVNTVGMILLLILMAALIFKDTIALIFR